MGETNARIGKKNAREEKKECRIGNTECQITNPGNPGGSRMSTLYIYFGLRVFFYSNEHTPIHVHGRAGGRESKAEIVVEDGAVVRVEITPVGKRKMLEGAQLDNFIRLVTLREDEIVQKWTDFFALRRKVTTETITRHLP